jgi:biopolymer transport protein ExbD
MNLYNFRTFLAFFVCLFFATLFTLYSFVEQKEPKHSFIVKVPKVFNPNFTDDEFLRYFSDGNYVPPDELQRRQIAIPNVCRTLLVSIQKDSKIKLNMQNKGSLSNLEPLTDELQTVLAEREENKVYEPNSNKIVKTIIVRSTRSIKYGEVVKVIDAIKSSGAEPIVLQIDDLPN